MTPTKHVLTRTNKMPPIDHDALIVRFSQSDGITSAVIELRTLKDGNWVTKRFFEKRTTKKESALSLATDLAKITGIQDVYILQGPDAPSSRNTS